MASTAWDFRRGQPLAKVFLASLGGVVMVVACGGTSANDPGDPVAGSGPVVAGRGPSGGTGTAPTGTVTP